MWLLLQISQIEVPFLNVNCAHLEQFEPDLYRQLINYPQEVIPAFDMAANELFFQRHPDVALPHQIQVRPFNAEKTQSMRALNPEGKTKKDKTLSYEIMDIILKSIQDN